MLLSLHVFWTFIFFENKKLNHSIQSELTILSDTDTIIDSIIYYKPKPCQSK